jgi:hypothetical protein
MHPVTADFLASQLHLSEQLRAGRATMLTPQDLPGRFGRVIHSIDRWLAILDCEAVVAGGWAVWRHGYVGRVTQDIGIVLPQDKIVEFLRVASQSGFEVLPQPLGRWPKLRHKDTEIEVDILPEGGRPGTATRPAPTTIVHPHRLGAAGSVLCYMNLPALIELKLAAGRPRDESDVAELVRANPEQVAAIRSHLATVHNHYVKAFDCLVQRAQDE